MWFEYGKTTSYGYSTTTQSKSSTGSFSKGISGLDDDTTYHFRAVASNSEGTDYGTDYIFTTEKEIEQPQLSYSPTSHNFGDTCEGETDRTTFEIWNSGSETLIYSLSESCSWVDVHPTSDSSTGEHDTITVDIDTANLSEGSHICDISISSEGGSETFTVMVNVVPCQTPSLRGDLNGDGVLTPADAAIVLEIAVGSRPCNATTLATADVNGDGRVTSLDALMILQAAAGAMDLS